MNAEEFLVSDMVRRRSKISAFDAEIRLLRSRGVGGEGIAIFLKLNNVQITKSGVNKYFRRHPDRYPTAKAEPMDRDPPIALSKALPSTGSEPTARADDRTTPQPSPSQLDKSALPPEASGSPAHSCEAGSERERSTVRHGQMDDASQGPRRVDSRPAVTFSGDRVQEEVNGLCHGTVETLKDHGKPDAFNPRPGADANYDGGAGLSKSAEAIARSSDQPYRSPLIRFGTSEN